MPAPKKRLRPVLTASVSPEAAAAVRERAVKQGTSPSRIIDGLLRRAIGLPELPNPPAIRVRCG